MRQKSELINGVSVVICCYNSATKLPETLKHLAMQVVSDELYWEIVLVDNNCTDNTTEVATKIWSNFKVSTNLKVVKEELAGLTYARNKGIQESKHDIIIYCDDDNWLNPNYVQTAYEIMESNTEIGALGGWCEAVFENKKPDWFDTYARFFAVSKQGEESGDITNKKGCLYGAGMVLRKNHWEYLNQLSFKPLLTCRKGDTLSSGGDTEYSYVLRLLGYKIWYDERLYFQHYMPEGRLNLDYIKRIRKAMSESNFVVRVYIDRLKNNVVSENAFRRKFKSEIRHKLKSNIKKRLLGSFEEKEQAKEYFRNLKRLLFGYKDYEENSSSIDKWLLKHTRKTE